MFDSGRDERTGENTKCTTMMDRHRGIDATPWESRAAGIGGLGKRSILLVGGEMVALIPHFRQTAFQDG